MGELGTQSKRGFDLKCKIEAATERGTENMKCKDGAFSVFSLSEDRVCTLQGIAS